MIYSQIMSTSRRTEVNSLITKLEKWSIENHVLAEISRYVVFTSEMYDTKISLIRDREGHFVTWIIGVTNSR